MLTHSLPIEKYFQTEYGKCLIRSQSSGKNFNLFWPKTILMWMNRGLHLFYYKYKPSRDWLLLLRNVWREGETETVVQACTTVPNPNPFSQLWFVCMDQCRLAPAMSLTQVLGNCYDMPWDKATNVQRLSSIQKFSTGCSIAHAGIAASLHVNYKLSGIQILG